MQQLHATLRATISIVDTRCNVARNVARNVAPCLSWSIATLGSSLRGTRFYLVADARDQSQERVEARGSLSSSFPPIHRENKRQVPITSDRVRMSPTVEQLFP